MANRERLMELFGDAPNITDEVIEILDRIMNLPLDVRLNLVAAVEAYAKIEEQEPSKTAASDRKPRN